MMMKKKIVWLLPLLCSGCVHAMVELNHAMFQATNLQEFRAAFVQTNQNQHSSPPRHLQQQTNEQPQDSLPIYADSFENGQPGFYHGVASGDPLPDAVILWTRYTPTNGKEEIELELRLAATMDVDNIEDLLDPDQNTNLRRAKVVVTNATDFVAKIDVTGLQEGSDYVFAFSGTFWKTLFDADDDCFFVCF